MDGENIHINITLCAPPPFIHSFIHSLYCVFIESWHKFTVEKK